jgi:hypothetical protein
MERVPDMITLYHAKFFPRTATYTIQTVTADQVTKNSVFVTAHENYYSCVKRYSRVKKYEGFFLDVDGARNFIESGFIAEAERLSIELGELTNRQRLIEQNYAVWNINAVRPLNGE